MVQQSVDDRGCEHIAPGCKALVACQDHRTALVSTADQLGEQIGALALDGQVADLIDDQQAWGRVDLELFV